MLGGSLIEDQTLARGWNRAYNQWRPKYERPAPLLSALAPSQGKNKMSNNRKITIVSFCEIQVSLRGLKYLEPVVLWFCFFLISGFSWVFYYDYFKYPEVMVITKYKDLPPYWYYAWYLEIAVDRFRCVHIADLSGINMYHGEIVVRMIRVCPHNLYVLHIDIVHWKHVWMFIKTFIKRCEICVTFIHS